MPSLGMYSIKPPTDSREFENITRDYFSYKYSLDAKLFGRPGQKQYGVDIIISEEDRITAIQCKDYQKTKVTTQMIDDWICLAEEFEPYINKLIIAIAAEIDSNIQKYVLKCNEQRKEEMKFSVEVLYWEEIISFLKTQPTLFKKYYIFDNMDFYQKSSNIAYRNANELKVEFVDLVIKSRIEDFLLEDPFVRINTEYLQFVDWFEGEMQELFKKAVLLKETDEYMLISDYYNKCKEYIEYLWVKVQPCNNGQFVKINNIYLDDYEVINAIIHCLKDEIFKIYNKITS